MAKGPETKFKEQVLRSLRGLDNCWVEKIQQLSIRGTPDCLGCLDKMFFALELKASKNAHIDKLQLYKLEQIKNAGGFAEVTHPENWEEVFNKLRRISRI